MHEVTLNVPGEQAKFFRLSVLEKVKDSAEWIESVASELPRFGPRVTMADLHGAHEQLDQDTALLDAVGLNSAGPIEITNGSVSQLRWVCHGMRRVLVPAMEEALCSESPDLEELRSLKASYEWATEREDELSEQDLARTA
jgi:hypothetical protein